MAVSTNFSTSWPDKALMLDKVIEIITLKKELFEIITPYGVTNSAELYKKFNEHLGNDHPLYEDFLAAKQIENDLKSSIKNMKKLLEELIPE